MMYILRNSIISDDVECPSGSYTYCKSFQMCFSYSYAAVDKISIDIMLHCPSAIVELHVKIVVNTVRLLYNAVIDYFVYFRN